MKPNHHARVMATVPCEILIEHPSSLIVKQGRDMFRIGRHNIKSITRAGEQAILEIDDFIASEFQMEAIK